MERSYSEREKIKLAALKETQWGRYIYQEAKRQKRYYFYRFIEYKHLEDFLATHQLKVSELSKSNDPLEFLPAFSCSQEKELWRRNKSDSLFASICLTRMLSTGAMWGHYADGHKGVCLVFKLPLTRLLQGAMPSDYTVFPEARAYSINQVVSLVKVLYKSERPKFNRDVRRAMHKRMFSWFFNATMTKAPEWEYEQEYKLILPDELCVQRDGKVYYGGLWRYFKGVVLGVQCTHSSEEVKKMFHKYSCGNIRVSRARISSTRYIVEDERYSDTPIDELDAWCLGDDTLLEASVKMGFAIKKGDIYELLPGVIPESIQKYL